MWYGIRTCFLHLTEKDVQLWYWSVRSSIWCNPKGEFACIEISLMYYNTLLQYYHYYVHVQLIPWEIHSQLHWNICKRELLKSVENKRWFSSVWLCSARFFRPLQSYFWSSNWCLEIYIMHDIVLFHWNLQLLSERLIFITCRFSLWLLFSFLIGNRCQTVYW